MRLVRNPAGSVVGRTPKLREQLLHDPFRDAPITYFIKSSTFWETWPSVFFFLLEAGIIAFLNRPTKSLSVSTTILTVLGTVIGFAISYRTSSAYGQYIEARKGWGNLIHHSRTLARFIWFHIPNELRPHSDQDPALEAEKVQALLEKKTMINLIQAFSVSLKHFLRGEYGIYYDDLYHLTCFLPKYSQFGPNSASTGIPQLPDLSRIYNVERSVRENGEEFDVDLERQHSQMSEFGAKTGSASVLNYQGADPLNPPKKLFPGYNPPKKNKYDFFPFLRFFRSLAKSAMNVTQLRQRSYRGYDPEQHLSLEILWQLSIYVATLQKRKIIDVPTTNTLNASLVGLSDALANLERVLTTPIPFGYHVHLKTIIWGYLTFLPFQLIGTFKKITIPATGLIAFAFLGFLKIAEDIENPFGYESNDLDLDHFCQDIIARECDELTATPPSEPLSYVLIPSNTPLFGKGCFYTAAEMSSEEDELRLINIIMENQRLMLAGEEHSSSWSLLRCVAIK
ncbi:hypothetical protein O181_011078 [Austropuccinia psidii MF-1]|uniref:Uncharacterized protein n=1 Tax=Austropuccinia psidii MF-1 TaxID=1389203 RepID=A0A9Q3BU73_9BASI|nr:hypothetical protein [Austropuccinia psidii MF-1]